MALKLAHFPHVKKLAGFDFGAQPAIDPKQVCDLAAWRWIANGENVLLLGPPDVGKTHPSTGARTRGDPGRLLGAVHHRHCAGCRARQGSKRESARREAPGPFEAEAPDRDELATCLWSPTRPPPVWAGMSATSSSQPGPAAKDPYGRP
jgi:IstB-like ATP binding protein